MTKQLTTLAESLQQNILECTQTVHINTEYSRFQLIFSFVKNTIKSNTCNHKLTNTMATVTKSLMVQDNMVHPKRSLEPLLSFHHRCWNVRLPNPQSFLEQYGKCKV